jgi:hypothetical protein
MSIVATNEKAVTGNANALCATKRFITAKIMIADYQQKGIYYEKENFSSCVRTDIVFRNDRMCVMGQSSNGYEK